MVLQICDLSTISTITSGIRLYIDSICGPPLALQKVKVDTGAE